MTYTYKTKGTCSTQIDLELEGNIVHNVKFTGGCNGIFRRFRSSSRVLPLSRLRRKSAASPATDARLPAAISWLRPVAKPTRHPSRRKETPVNAKRACPGTGVLIFVD